MSRAFRAPFEGVWLAAQDALGSVAGSIKQADRTTGQIKASVRMGLWSWGEAIELTVTPGSGSLVSVTVSSRSRMPTTLVDWGKNRKNVSTILYHMDRVLSASATSQRNVADELARLAALKERGALTEEEFDQRKRRLLGGS